MSYSAPKVSVYQEYASSAVAATSADLIPCIIGPCYYIVDEVNDPDASFLMSYSSQSDIRDVYFPSTKAGTIIDRESVKVRVGGSPKVLYKTDFAATSLIADSTIIQFASLSLSDIKVGDTLIIKRDDTNAVVHTARAVEIDLVNDRVLMNMACLTDTSAMSLIIDVLRPIPIFSIPYGGNGVRSVLSEDGSATITFSGGVISVDTNNSSLDLTPIFVLVDNVYSKLYECSLYVGYRARNTSVNKIIELINTADLEREIGDGVPENPLGFAASLVFANMDRVPLKVFGTVDDTLASWVEAKDKISIDPDIYSVVPLTQDPSILAIFKEHCESMSTPDAGAFRICIGSGEIDTDDLNPSATILVEGSATLVNNSDDVLCILTDATAEFISSGVAVGDEVRLYDADGIPYSFTVGVVTAENMLKVPASTPFEVNNGDNLNVVAESTTGISDGYQAANVANLVVDEDELKVGNDTTDGALDTFIMVSETNVPKDATVVEATLNLTLKETLSSEVILTIHGVLADPTVIPPTTKAELAQLVQTTASVAWTISSGSAGAIKTSPDIKTIITEITAQAGWTYGGNIILMIEDNSSVAGNTATFCSLEYNGGVNRPYLAVEYTPDPFVEGGVYSYRIVHEMTAAEKAVKYKDLSISLASPTRANMVNIWPTSCKISGYSDTFPGYYLACALGGRIGQIPSQQGLTRSSLAGISGLGNIGYFSSSQLDTIASGGTFILTQANESSVPIIRHQLTTNMSTIEFRELSFVKNFDYVSLVLKRALNQFLGRYNITQRNLGILGTAIEANLESMKLDQQAVIGAPIIDYKIRSITQLEAQRDRVEIYIDVLFPYVLNYIGLHIVSQ